MASYRSHSPARTLSTLDGFRRQHDQLAPDWRGRVLSMAMVIIALLSSRREAGALGQ